MGAGQMERSRVKGQGLPSCLADAHANVLPGPHPLAICNEQNGPLQDVCETNLGTSTAGNEDCALERPGIPIRSREGVLPLSGQGGFRAPHHHNNMGEVVGRRRPHLAWADGLQAERVNALACAGKTCCPGTRGRGEGF